MRFVQSLTKPSLCPVLGQVPKQMGDQTMEGHGASSPESLLVCLAAHTRSSSDVTGQSGQCF